MQNFEETLTKSPQRNGKTAEMIGADKLRSLGMSVKMMPYQSPFDLLANGKHVEVKLSRFGSSTNVWAINLHRHGALDETDVDAYLVILTEVPGGGKMPIYLVIPAPIGASTMEISVPSLIRKYSKYVDNWAAIGPVKGEESA